MTDSPTIMVAPGADGTLEFTLTGGITSPSEGDPIVDAAGSDVYGKRVLFNLEACPYINSAGIGWILIIHKRFVSTGGKVVYHSMPPSVDQVLKLLKMDRVLHLCPDRESALTCLQES